MTLGEGFIIFVIISFYVAGFYTGYKTGSGVEIMKETNKKLSKLENIG